MARAAAGSRRGCYCRRMPTRLRSQRRWPRRLVNACVELRAFFIVRSVRLQADPLKSGEAGHYVSKLWCAMTVERIAALVAAAVLCAFCEGAAAQSPEAGRREYEARCAACHGADGEGSGHGPGFVNVRQPRAKSRTELRELIRKGIPDAGMPGFALPDHELDAIAAYAESLRVSASERPVAGNVQRGEAFFAGKGGCASCHKVDGRGGIFGPDLSNLAGERRLPQIERALRTPSDSSPPASASSSFRRVSLRPARRTFAPGPCEVRERVRRRSANAGRPIPFRVEGVGRGDVG